MEKQEIVAGLKSALERGYSIQQAIQSFINSGYNRQDVLDSARNINTAVISKIPVQPSELVPQYPKPIRTFQPQQIKQPIQPQQQVKQPIQYSQPKYQQPTQQTKQPTQYSQPQSAPSQTYSSTFSTQQSPIKTKSNLGLIIFLTGLLIILLGTLALFLFAKEQVLDFFSNLGF